MEVMDLSRIERRERSRGLFDKDGGKPPNTPRTPSAGTDGAIWVLGNRNANKERGGGSGESRNTLVSALPLIQDVYRGGRAVGTESVETGDGGEGGCAKETGPVPLPL